MKTRMVCLIRVVIFTLGVSLQCSCDQYLHGEKVPLRVKNNHGSYSEVYLKATSDYAVLSSNNYFNVPDFYYDDNFRTNGDPVLLYKNTFDTLYVVWFSNDSTGRYFPDIDANIVYVWGDAFSWEKVEKYKEMGFIKFPDRLRITRITYHPDSIPIKMTVHGWARVPR